MLGEKNADYEKVLPGTERRIRSTIGALLQDEALSAEAREILRHLKDSDRDLAEISAEELRELLLDGLP